LAAVVGVCAAAGLAAGQDGPKKPPPQPPASPAPAAPAKPAEPPKAPAKPADEPEAMDRLASQPGPEHERLARLVGEFTTESTLTMAPNQPGTKSTGHATISMILGGRFLQIQESGELKVEMNGQMLSMPYEAIKTLGYNNGSRKYESSWLWSNETSIMTMKGQSKDDGKTVECQATFDNEAGLSESLIATFIFTDADHFSTTIKTNDGPAMQTVYTRKPAGEGPKKASS
jgi:hypothetical protein